MIDGNWLAVRDGDARLVSLYRRHYSSEGRRRGNQVRCGFSGPGESMALLTRDCRAAWMWVKAIVANGAQVGVMCSLFRNESSVLSSELIREAVELAWQRWPGERLFTYVADAKVRSTNPGYCFKKAGWKTAGRNADGRLTILELTPAGAGSSSQ